MVKQRNKHYDLIIVGGGIAGLATAEIFARSGFKVALVEKYSELCSGSSGKQHGWFHLGSLYSINRDAIFLKTLVNNCDILLSYYRDFRGMNICFDPKSGRLSTPTKNIETPWFNDESSRLIYFVDQEITDEEQRGFRDYHGISWEVATRLFLARHNRYLKYDWRKGKASKYIPSASFNDVPPSGEISKLKVSQRTLQQIPFDTSSYKSIVGFDRSMNVSFIVKELIKSFLFYSGDIYTNSEFLRYERKAGRLEVTLKISENNSLKIKGSKLIQAMGKGLNLGIVKEVYFQKITNVVSPLLVVSPSLCNHNFQILSPVRRDSMNHIIHHRGGIPYSLIGDSSSANPNNVAQKKQIQRALKHKVAKKFPELRNIEKQKVYFCYKTELVGRKSDLDRNYSYIIEDIDEDVYVIIPGKLSLNFSLAVNTFIKLQGHPPSPIVDSEYINHTEDESKYFSILYHEKEMDKLLKEKKKK